MIHNGIEYAMMQAYAEGLSVLKAKSELSLALMARFASQGQDDYASKLLAMMPASFGGHAVHPAENK